MLEGIEVAIDLYQHRQEVASFWQRLKRLIRLGRTRIAIVGAGGTGKSSLARFLESGARVERAYHVSPIPEKRALSGHLLSEVIAYPGQERRMADQYRDIVSRLSSGKITGVVNVVAYGMHSLEVREWAEHALARQASDIHGFFDLWTKEARAIELRAVAELATAIRVAKRREFWMVTLLNKQDLWWSDRSEARRFYAEGEYAERIEEIRRTCSRFDHSFSQASLEMFNLTTGAGECLKETERGYDRAMQEQHLRDFVRTINKLSGRSDV